MLFHLPQQAYVLKDRPQMKLDVRGFEGRLRVWIGFVDHEFRIEVTPEIAETRT